MWIESMIVFGIQCNTEGLQIDKAGIYTYIQSQMDNWSDSCLRGFIRHFMCTLLGEMVLVRTVGHRCQDHTENDLAKQLNSETVTK